METRVDENRKKKFDSILTFLSSTFGQEECVRCGSQTAFRPLCPACQASLRNFPAIHNNSPFKRCRRCGRLLVSEVEFCSSCRQHPVLMHTDGVFALHSYRFWKKDLMFAWKSLENRSLVSVFASVMDKALVELFEIQGKALPLVPVPPRRGKIRRKGWDQIEDLGQVLKKKYHHRVYRLLRRRSYIQQKKLDRIQRLNLNETAYCLISEKRRKRLLKELPEAVVLIDDVLTTGSTLEHCARALKRGGIKEVYGITLFFA